MLKSLLLVFWLELKEIFTNRHLRLICLISPFFYTILLTSVYYSRRMTKVPVGLVDMEQSRMTLEAARYLDAMEGVRILKAYPSPQAAELDLASGEIYGYFYFPKDFSSKQKRGNKAIIRIAADYMNIALANPIFLSAADLAGHLSARGFALMPAKPHFTKERAEALSNTIRPEIYTIFNPRMDYSLFFLPGLVVIIMQQIIIVGLCFRAAWIREKKLLPVYWHSISSKKAPYLALFGRFLAYVLLNYVLSCGFMLIWLRLFGIYPMHYIWDILLFIFVFNCACGAFGLIISPLFKRTARVFTVLMYFSMTAFLVSGYCWPSYMLRFYIRAIALPIPSTHFMIWLRRAFGHALPYSFLAKEFWFVAALAALYLFLALLFSKKALYSRTLK